MVGGYLDGGSLTPFSEVFAGSRWTPESLPDPVGAVAQSSFVESVSCLSPGNCVAVGHYDIPDAASSTSVDIRPMISTLAGTTWHSVPAPIPSDVAPGADGAFDSLDSVSCAGGSCTAVGGYVAATGARSLVDVLTGTTWQTSGATSPSSGPDSNPSLRNVSCSSATLCTSVGDVYDSTNITKPFVLVDHPNGRTDQLAPLPSGVSSTSLDLDSLSCSSSGLCTAVGYVRTSPQQAVLVTID